MRRLTDIAAVLLLLVVSTRALAATSTTEFYSEQTYLDRENRYQGNVRLRTDLGVTPYLFPYLQVGGELQNAFDGVPRPWDGSYVYAGPGVKVTGVPFLALFVEPRFRAALSSGTISRSVVDFRTLLVAGRLWVTPIAAPLSSLVELYSETLLTSFDRWNVIEAAYVRAGVRYAISPTLNADLFLEPFVTLDRIGHHYNNRADLKLSARIESRQRNLTFSLTGSLLANTYFTARITEANPYAGRNFGFRLLAVVGGLW